MDHHGFMTGMLLGGALVASVPTLLAIGVIVYAVRQQRADRQRKDAADTTAEEGTT